MTPAQSAAIAAVRERVPPIGYLDAVAALERHGWRVDPAVEWLRVAVVRVAQPRGLR